MGVTDIYIAQSEQGIGTSDFVSIFYAYRKTLDFFFFPQSELDAKTRERRLS